MMPFPGSDGFCAVLTLDRAHLAQQYHLVPASHMPRIDERQCDDETDEQILDEDVSDLKSFPLSCHDIQDRDVRRPDFRDGMPTKGGRCVEELDFPPGFREGMKRVAIETANVKWQTIPLNTITLRSMTPTGVGQVNTALLLGLNT